MKNITWKNNRVLDLCTGSGALGIISALSNPDIQVDLVDICPKALKVAQINVDKHDLRKRVKCIQSDLFKNIKYYSFPSGKMCFMKIFASGGNVF